MQYAAAFQETCFALVQDRVLAALDHLDHDEQDHVQEHDHGHGHGHVREPVRQIREVTLSGGVAANRELRRALSAALYMRSNQHHRGVARGGDGKGVHMPVRLVCPPRHLCSDNAAMIAWTAIEMIITQRFDASVEGKEARDWPLPRWPVGEFAEAAPSSPSSTAAANL